MKYAIWIVVAFIVWILVLTVIQFMAAYWHVVLGVLAVAVFAVVVVAIVRSGMAEQDEATRKAQLVADKAARQAQVVATADAFLEDARSLLTACFIIDSNIWMNEAYDDFFSTLKIICENAQYVIAMDGAQFDEIANVKAATEFKHRKNRAARLGMNRIEEFQKLGRLRLERLAASSVRGAYADPLLVNILSTQAATGIPCTFISDDRELRIRVREHLSRVPNAQWRIVEMQEILTQCHTVVKALRYRLKPHNVQNLKDGEGGAVP